jgi:SAM-dependent methyltransferase
VNGRIFVRRLKSAINRVSKRLLLFMHPVGAYKKFAATAELLDEQYRTNQWAWLNDPREVAHYAVIAGYVRCLKPGAAVLDIACGEGILRDHLQAAYRVDVSKAAIEAASRREDAITTFVEADATTYVPPETYDVIVFNECLYYFERPLDVVRRYEAFLRPGGVIIGSMFRDRSSLKIWRALGRSYRIIDEVRVAHVDGEQWTVRVFQPAS